MVILVTPVLSVGSVELLGLVICNYACSTQMLDSGSMQFQKYEVFVTSMRKCMALFCLCGLVARFTEKRFVDNLFEDSSPKGPKEYKQCVLQFM